MLGFRYVLSLYYVPLLHSIPFFLFLLLPSLSFLPFPQFSSLPHCLSPPFSPSLTLPPPLVPLPLHRPVPSFPTLQRSCLFTLDVLRRLHLFLWPAPQSCDMFCDFWFSSWLFQIFRLCLNSFELNCNLLIN